MKEMLQELKEHYELILMSNQNLKYVQRVVKSFEKDEKFFEYYITKEDLFLIPDIKYYVCDLNILLQKRELKDIVVIANSCGKYMF